MYFVIDTSVDSSTINEYRFSPMSSTISSSSVGNTTFKIIFEHLVLCKRVFSKIDPFHAVLRISPEWSVLLIAE